MTPAPRGPGGRGCLLQKTACRKLGAATGPPLLVRTAGIAPVDGQRRAWCVDVHQRHIVGSCALAREVAAVAADDEILWCRLHLRHADHDRVDQVCGVLLGRAQRAPPPLETPAAITLVVGREKESSCSPSQSLRQNRQNLIESRTYWPQLASMLLSQ